MGKKINVFLGNNLQNKTISILGLSFKPETDDVRESPALNIIPYLLKNGAKIKVYDPQAMEEAKKIFSKNVNYFSSSNECASNADAVVILTEWNEFRALSLKDLKKIMSGDKLIDFRNIFSPKAVKEAGFKYLSIGR